MSDRLILTKQQARDLAPTGYEYGGFIDGFYMYQSGNYQDGFYAMFCLPEDMTPENLEFMAKHRLSRIDGEIVK